MLATVDRDSLIKNRRDGKFLVEFRENSLSIEVNRRYNSFARLRSLDIFAERLKSYDSRGPER